MKFELKTNPEPYDIIIANIRSKDIKSEHIIQYTDFSARYEDNRISSLKNTHTTLKDGTDYTLQSYSYENKVMLTGEYFYDFTTGITTSLWYIHRINKPVFLSKVNPRSMKRVIRNPDNRLEKEIRNLLPDTRKYILAHNSISVLKDGSPVPFSVDYGAGTIFIEDTDIHENDEYIVYYLLVENVFKIITQGIIEYRIELYKYYDTSNYYFSMSVLSSSMTPLIVNYSTIEPGGRTRDIEETTIGEILYVEVNETNFDKAIYSGSANRVFHISAGTSPYTIKVNNNSRNLKYTFKAADNHNSIVRIEIPQNRPYHEPWYVEITSGRFTYNGVSYIVYPPDLNLRKVTDTPLIVNSSTVSMSYRNIFTTINEYGSYNNIKVLRDGEYLYINMVDPNSGIIYVNETLKFTDKLTAHYYHHYNSYTLTDLSLNPLDYEYHYEYDITQYIIVFVVIPEVRNPELKKRVYPVFLKKYGKDGIIEYSFDDIDELINGPGNETIRESIPDLPVELITSDEYLPILGFVYISNPLDTDAFYIEDARVYGGGKTEPLKGYYDYSIYDGERTDLSTVLHVHIPQMYFDDLISRLKIYDNDVLLSDTPDEIAQRKAEQLIDEKLNKFLPLGTVWERFMLKDND